MARLNQILAVEKGVKSTVYSEMTRAYHEVQKSSLLSGLSRTYQPKDEEGEQLPPESTKVQVSAEEILGSVANNLSSLFDVVATKDATNSVARADIVLTASDGTETLLLEDIPAVTLLFLEKQLVDIHTFIKKLPVLDSAEDWHYNESANVFSTPPVKTIRTRKVPRNHVKAPATERHPAQVDVYFEDVPVGYWTTVKFSGALPAKRIAELLERVERLQRAVKFARETANGTHVIDKKIAGPIFGYLLG